MNKKGERTNIEAQEAVVSALWDFTKMIKERQPDSRNEDDISLPLSAVRETLKKILKAFGYKIIEVQ